MYLHIFTSIFSSSAFSFSLLVSFIIFNFSISDLGSFFFTFGNNIVHTVAADKPENVYKI